MRPFVVVTHLWCVVAAAAAGTRYLSPCFFAFLPLSLSLSTSFAQHLEPWPGHNQQAPAWCRSCMRMCCLCASPYACSRVGVWVRMRVHCQTNCFRQFPSRVPLQNRKLLNHFKPLSAAITLVHCISFIFYLILLGFFWIKYAGACEILSISFVTNEAAATAENIRDESRWLEMQSMLLSPGLSHVRKLSIVELTDRSKRYLNLSHTYNFP